MAHVCCRRGFTPHYGLIEHASFSSFALAPYLPLSLQLFASGGNYSVLYRPLHLTFCFRTFFCLSQAEFALNLFAFILTLNIVYLPPFIFLLLLVNLSYIHVLLPFFASCPIYCIISLFSGQKDSTAEVH